ncbi:hypothetical protein [Streptomyces sp. NPDC053367]|uniref:hypothetical protein n=1 Tax=Streptomyces sp. NPDC053367 TaxID=3365700 RepID=UPI0037D2E3CA
MAATGANPNDVVRDAIRKAVSHFCGIALAVAVLSATLLGINGGERPLVVATGALAAVMCLFWGGGFLWDKLAASDKAATPAPAPTLALVDNRSPLKDSVTASVQLAVTIQGVVLGLIFAFVGNKDVTNTVKVAVIALGVGVISGILLFTFVSHQIFGVRTQAFVVIFQYITLWGLSYGLLCIISAVVAT